MADMRLQQQRQQNTRSGQKNAQAKPKKSGWGALVIAIILINALSGAFEDADGEDIVLAAVIGVIVISAIIAAAVFAMKKRAGSSGSPVAERSGRVSAAVQRRDPRSKSFTQPEAYCVVCDHSGEDHFQRDKARRIAQLEDWLKNGLIDRAEYQVLKHRYENDL